MQHFALRCLANQLLHGGSDGVGRFRYDLALCRGRQRDAQALLQICQPMPRKSTSVTEQRDHARRRLIVLVLAHSLGSVGRECLTAQIAAQLLQRIDGGFDRCLTFHPH